MRDETTPEMRDRGLFWSPAAGAGTTIERAGWSADLVTGLSLALVSGRLEAARADLAPAAREVGLWGLAEGDAAWVRIARDRALLVTERPREIAAGWNASGYVATPCDDVHATIEIAGPALRDVIARCVSADLDAQSPSAATQFAGIWALVYRVGEDRARIHVERPLGTHAMRWLEGLSL